MKLLHRTQLEAVASFCFMVLRLKQGMTFSLKWSFFSFMLVLFVNKQTLKSKKDSKKDLKSLLKNGVHEKSMAVAVSELD